MSKILLSNQFIRNNCKLALNEDLYPSGDITTSLIKKNANKKAKLIANQNGIIGGLKFVIQTFKLIDNISYFWYKYKNKPVCKKSKKKM